ncbi:hypothetical protein BD780_001923 [Clostridium tetanomorphum]|uniref:Uncharacterized protein n=1 Tax=Clostridium tetanomorphum TaxID=1553 RepID=A0A923E938_CLOTT|nr:hypothetical protein [Clostridium tetanomorphum]KAJ51515.1 hypothetical protein CTM_12195 [Clostridium tetanomorphum DSM 665]MBC2398867.1 hypothetical protein [Clostridium tetanomorphum]MBP1865163.1 hypothetical protein [Clostridium tetanomorphum]NRS84698.1 hypothetical protein [Clostridium tetanomorphum]NRZ97913.1 hypothetical protein [Clostridium tetanomorphum]
MYDSGYNRLFWGMIFIIFDINLENINILPNFVGYILIYSALNILISQHEIYEKGKIPSMILIILTLKDIVYTGKDSLLSEQFQSINIFGMITGSIISIINIYLIYIICKGIYYLAIDRGMEKLKNSIEIGWKSYFIIATCMMYSIPFFLNFSRKFNIFVTILAMINLGIMIYLAVLFRRCRLSLKE